MLMFTIVIALIMITLSESPDADPTAMAQASRGLLRGGRQS